MKNITYIVTLLLSVLLLVSSCNDSFLERYPTHDLNDNNYWGSLDNLKVYNNGIYNQAGKNSDYMFMVGFTHDPYYSSEYSVVGYEAASDNFASTISAHEFYTRMAAGQETIPTEPRCGGWKWDLLRRINVFLANYDKVEDDQTKKNYYAGEALFFRAWFYFDKVQYFGDVPYISKPLNTDSPELFEPRMPRKDVMDSVLVDINKAIEYLPEDWSAMDANHPDRASKWAALALKARLCLFEGTFRKYHNLGDHEVYLREAVDAAEKVMAGPFSLYNTGNPKADYRTLFTSTELNGNPEVIFARRYHTSILGHRQSGYIVSQAAGATHGFVEDFLCLENGKAVPVALSSTYSDETIEKVFDNRDPRLSQTVLDPWEAEIICPLSKFEFPRLLGMKNWETPTGYHFIKYYDAEDDKKGYGNEENDFPLFRLAEMYLIYAEAKAELGTITQADLDESINLLRDRAGMPHMDMNPQMDPKYAGEGLSSLLIEIRRERRVKLSFELLRYPDLLRWKKGAYLNKKVLGMRLEDADVAKDARYEGTTVKTVEVNGKKYIDVFATSDFGKRSFTENKHYYHPLPVNVISKNPQLKQNPNW